jgi:hypothetical protein
MGHAPFVGVIAGDCLTETIPEPVQIFPKKAHVQMHRAGAIRFPQLHYPLADEHKRYAAPLVLLDAVKRATDRHQKRGHEKIVRDHRIEPSRNVVAGEASGRYFLDIYAPLSGVMVGPTGELVVESAGRPFSSGFKILSRAI